MKTNIFVAKLVFSRHVLWIERQIFTKLSENTEEIHWKIFTKRGDIPRHRSGNLLGSRLSNMLKILEFS